MLTKQTIQKPVRRQKAPFILFRTKSFLILYTLNKNKMYAKDFFSRMYAYRIQCSDWTNDANKTIPGDQIVWSGLPNAKCCT
jgi:hypothetical protein